MQSHLETINLHETKGDPLELKETSITLGFENFAHPKLVSPGRTRPLGAKRLVQLTVTHLPFRR